MFYLKLKLSNIQERNKSKKALLLLTRLLSDRGRIKYPIAIRSLNKKSTTSGWIIFLCAFRL